MRQWNRLILTGMLALSLATQNAPLPAAAAMRVATPAEAGPAAPAANPGIQYKLVYNNVAGVFEVYMKPDTTLVTPHQMGYAQVTLKAPAGFVISAGPTATAGMAGTLAAPIELPTPASATTISASRPARFPNNTPTWTAGTEVKMFTFSGGTVWGRLASSPTAPTRSSACPASARPTASWSTPRMASFTMATMPGHKARRSVATRPIWSRPSASPRPAWQPASPATCR